MSKLSILSGVIIKKKKRVVNPEVHTPVEIEIL